MTVAQQITRISGGVNDIKTAIANKGVTVPSGSKVDDLADLVDDIDTVNQTSALQYMLNNKTTYAGIAAGFTSLTDLPTFTQPSGIKDYRYMFAGDTSLVAPTFQGLTIPSASNLEGMFYGCTNLTYIPFLSSGDHSRMFFGCTNLSDISVLSSHTTAMMSTELMFYNCSGVTGSVTLPAFENSSDASRAKMFRGCTGITSISKRNDNFYASDLTEMFYGCTALTSVELGTLRTSSLTSTLLPCDYMFADCRSLTSISPSTLFKSGRNPSFRHTFSNCSSITSIGTLDTSICSSLEYTFYGCSSLISLPTMQNGTSRCKSFSRMCYNCSSLTSFNVLDMSAATSTTALSKMVYGCTSLTNSALNNLLASIATKGGSSNTNKTLAYIGLTSAQATTCTGLSNWSTAQAAGWTTGY